MLKPEILTHPHIPKPLHGMNPRTILGKEWWDKTRFEAQAKYNYKCACCGIDKSKAKPAWLEGHEYWNINYLTGRCEVVEIVPLCHKCHNFIHSGRLSMILNKDKDKKEVMDILEHGFKILADNNLKVFPFTLRFAKYLKVNTYNVQPQSLDGYKPLKWSDYVMILEGKEYNSKFKDVNEWKNFYKK